MKRKIISKRKSLKYTVLVFVVLLVAIPVGLYQYNYFAVEKNRKFLMDFREDMIALQSEFNTVQDGWVYDEYCRGVGTTINRGDSITCKISLKNSNDDRSSESHDKYIKIIENRQVFEAKSLKNVIKTDRDYTVSLFSLRGTDDSECRLTDTSFVDDEKQGSVFFCNVYDAKAFHFRRQ